MEHPYHSVGARQDRAQTLAVMLRIAKALERIADSMEEKENDANTV